MKNIFLLSCVLTSFVISNKLNAQNINFLVERVNNVYETSGSNLIINPINNDLILQTRAGFYRSKDNGESWIRDYSKNRSDNIMRISPVDTNIIFTADAGSFYLHRSTDGGLSFTPTTNFPNDFSGSWDLILHPIQENILYVALQQSVLKSNDYGASWVDMEDGPNGLPDMSNYVKMYIDEDNPDTVFVFSETGGLFKTMDGGTNWSGCGANYQGGMTKDFCFTNNGTRLYLVENDRIYSSIDAGENWTHEYTINSTEECKYIGVNQNNPDIVFLVTVKTNDWTDYTLYRSEDGGSIFNEIYQFDDYFHYEQGYRFITDQANPNIMYYAGVHGHDDHFLLRTLDNGLTWEYIMEDIYSFSLESLCFTDNGNNLLALSHHPYYNNYDIPTDTTTKHTATGLANISTVMDPNANDYIYVANTAGLSRLSNNAQTMITLHSPNYEDVYYQGTAVDAANVGGNTHIYYGASDQSVWGEPSHVRLFKSTNAILFDSVPMLGNTSTISCIKIDQQNTDKVIVGTYGNGYFITENAGSTWQHYITPANIHKIAIHPTNSNIVFIYADGIYKSIDGADSFQKVNDAPNLYGWSWTRTSLLFHPDNHEMIFASDYDNIVYSTDTGNTWKNYSLTNENIDFGNIMFAFNPLNTNELYIASVSKGIFTANMVSINSVNVTNIPCNSSIGGSIGINASGTEPLQYSIDNGETFQSSNEFTSLSAAEYQIVVKDANETTVSWAETIVLTEPATVNLGDDITDCEGQTVRLDAGYFETYLWNDESTEQTLDVTTSGTYSVTVTDENSCVSSDEIVVTFEPLPTANITSGDVTTCEGETTDISIAFTGTAPWNFTYSDGTTPTTETTSDNPYSFTVSTAGTYQVTAVSDVNCIGTDFGNSAIIALEPLPIAGFTYDEDNLTVTFTNISENASSYLWNFGDDNTSTETNPVHTYTNAGNFQVELTSISDNCGNAIETQILEITTTSINDLEFNNFLTIVPNPSNGLITLEINNSVDEMFVEVIGVSGQVIYQKQFNYVNKTEQIDLSKNAKGIYFLRVKTSDFDKTGKLIIE